MRFIAVVCAAGLFCCPAMPWQQRPSAFEQPDQFEVGVFTYFDFGPPFDFYEIFVVRPAPTGTSVERITLTPPGIGCSAHAKAETASGYLTDSVAALMGSTNLCAIPEKVLRRKPKPCRHCLNFSGANVVMQVRCGTETRLIKTGILEEYWFNPSAHKPEQTSWTMQLMDRLKQAVGPGVMEKPIFQVSEVTEPGSIAADSATLREVSGGRYDGLFPADTVRASELYRSAQIRPAPPTVRLVSSSVPMPVETFPLPEYPPIARVTNVEGRVSFAIEIDPNGSPTNLTFASGAALLLPSVRKAVSQWRFPKESSGQQIQIAIEFALNCQRPAVTGNR